MEDLDTESVAAASEPSSSGKMGLAFGLIGVVGIVLGATGIFMANGSRKEMSELKATLEARPDRTVELEQKLATLEQSVMNVGAETVRIDRAIRTDMKNVVDTLGREIRTNRELVSKVSEELAQAAAAPAKVAAPAAKAEGGSGGAAAPEDGIHVIASGDTFGKLATRYGVSLDAILKANPGVDPQRLQIGQKINIP